MCKLLGPDMIILSGFLGANDDYMRGLTNRMESDFRDGRFSQAPIRRGTIAPVQSASLLALHTFCYSDRFDFDRFALAGDTPAASAGVR